MIKQKQKSQTIKKRQTITKTVQDNEQASSMEEEIIIKNLDSGTHQVFDQTMSESFVTLDQIQSSSQIKASLWNSYWQTLTNLQSKLLKLILFKHQQKLKQLLSQKPIQLNAYSYMDGQTLLHNAVSNSTPQITQLLIIKGIDLDVKTNNMKRTSLHLSVLLNKLQMVRILIQAGSNPNIKDIDGNTVLHHCCDKGNIKIFSLLVQRSIFELNFEQTNNQGVSVIDCCRNHSFIQLIFQYTSNREKQNILPTTLNQNCKINRRLLMKGQVCFNVYSRQDRIEKYLQIRQHQHQFKQHKIQTKNDTIIKKQKYFNLGKNHSRWLDKIGSHIACQSIQIMRQNILNTQDMSKNLDSIQNYEILRFIGSGGFAQVFLARKKKSSKMFALKRISKQKIIQNKLKKYVYAQKNIMIKCQHQFIVQAYSAFQDSTYLYLTMQYCQCGDLSKLISSKLYLDEHTVKLYAAQIGLALEYIHKKNILFRDLKPANILICLDGYLKISDFGLAKQSLVSFSFLGSVDYLAPQMLVDHQMKEHNQSIDWYLFGVVIYQLLVGRPPFYHQNQQSHFNKIKYQRVSFPKFISVSEQCKKLVELLLQKNPSKRIGAKSDFCQIKKHKWFQSVNWESLIAKQLQMQKVVQTFQKQQLRKKIEIDEIICSQKFEYFKQWNFSHFIK